MSKKPGKRPNRNDISTESKKKCFTPSTMSKPDYKSLVSELNGINKHWHSLGIHLGIDPSKLEEIEENYRTAERRKNEVLNTWLRIDPECTWEKLSEALREMGQNVIAESIETKYLHSSSEVTRVYMKETPSSATLPSPVLHFTSDVERLQPGSKLISDTDMDRLKCNTSMASRKRRYNETPQSMRKIMKKRRTTSNEQEIESATESITSIDHVALNLGQHDHKQSLDTESAKEACRQIIKSVGQIAQDLGQDTMQTSTQIQGILARLNSGKVKIGVAGMTNAGKSTALNALLGAKFLPASFQAQTAVKLCIISTSDETSPGRLFGRETTQMNHVELASGHDKIHKRLVELNDESRKQNLPYAELYLTAPVPFLQEKPDMSLEIYDTPGINESSSSSAAIGIDALEEMAAIILILDGGAVGTKGQDELIQELRRFHPLMESHGRVLILINKYDSLFDGNKESWTPEQLKMKVLRHFSKASSDTIIPFSARYALQARKWKANAENVSEDEYGEVFFFLTKTQKKDLISELKECCPENVEELATHLEDFSKIEKVESKLLCKLCEQGPTILLQSTIDDTLRIISELKHTIAQQQSSLDLPAKKREVSAQQDIVNGVDGVIKMTKERINQFPAVSSAVFASQKLNAATSILEGHIKVEVSNGVPTLHKDFNDQHSALQHIQTMKKKIVSKAENELEKAWPGIQHAIRMHFSEQLENELNRLEVTFVSRQVFDYLTLKGISADTIVNRISMPRPSLSVPNCSAIDDSALSGLVYPHPISKQRLENREKKGGRRYGLFGPRKTKHYVVAVNYQETVYRVRLDGIRSNFTKFASSCADHFNKSVNETVCSFAQKLSKEISKEVDAKLNRSSRLLHNELQKKKLDLEQSKKTSELLKENDRKLDEAVKKLH